MDKSIKPFHLVEQFNYDVVGVPERQWPHYLSTEEYHWLCKVLHEEQLEFLTAYGQSTIGQIDALIDLIYFAMGGLTRLGVTADQAEELFLAVHNANMQKAKGNKGRGSDLDAVKPTSWEGPEDKMKSILENENDN